MKIFQKSVLILITATSAAAKKGVRNDEFLELCNMLDKNDEILAMVDENPDLVHVHGKKGDTCLLAAARHHNFMLVPALVQKGANVDERNNLHPDQMPALGWFLLNGDHHTVQKLLEMGADANAVFHGIDHNGKTDEWFTHLDLLETIFASEELFNDKDPVYNHHIELPEIIEEYQQMEHTLKYHGGKYFKFLDADEL